MTQKDVIDALLDTGKAFLRKRGGICNGYEYTYPSSAAERNEVGNHGFRRRKTRSDDVIGSGILYLSGHTEDEIGPYGKFFDGPYVCVSADGMFDVHEGDALLHMTVSVESGEITDMSIVAKAGHIVEEIIPVFTDRMHNARFSGSL